MFTDSKGAGGMSSIEILKINKPEIRHLSIYKSQS